MAYTLDQADMVASQLNKLATGYAHHVVGHIANLGFWLDEAAHAIRAIDEYPIRYKMLREAQEAWIEAHGTLVSNLGFCDICGGICEFDRPRTPRPPERVRAQDLDDASADQECRVRSPASRLSQRPGHRSPAPRPLREAWNQP